MTDQQQNVSRQEIITYGAMAGPLRKLGQGVAAIEAATEAVWELSKKSSEDDAVLPSVPKEGSEYTIWLRDMWERLAGLNAASGKMLRQLSSEAVNVEVRFREGIDSMPSSQSSDPPRPSEMGPVSSVPVQSIGEPLTADAIRSSYDTRRKRGDRFVKLVVAPDLEKHAISLLEDDGLGNDLRGLVGVETQDGRVPGTWAIVGTGDPGSARSSNQGGRIVGR